MTLSEKVKAGIKASSTLKMSQFLGRSVGKKRSSSKRKVGCVDKNQSMKKLEPLTDDESCGSKMRLMSPDGSLGLSSQCGSADHEKKIHSSITQDVEKIPDSSEAEKKSNGLVEHKLRLPVVTCPEPKSEPAKKRHGGSNKIQCTAKKAAPGSETVSESSKRKDKPNKDGKKKKCKMSTGESSENKGQKRKSNAHIPSPKLSEPQKKRRSVHNTASAPQKNAASEKIENQQEEVSR